MATLLGATVDQPTERVTPPPTPAVGRGWAGRNWLAGLAGWFWLLVVLIPLYWIVITSFKASSDYYQQNAFAPPSNPTLANYRLVIENDFVHYFVNSVVVAVGTTVPTVVLALMAAYAIVRGAQSGLLRRIQGLFLMGLAIPLQAAIIPVYLLIIKLGLYDSLAAIAIPSIAFAIPLAVLVLSNFLRDIPRDLFESMRLDGAGEWTMLWRLAFPLTRPAMVTVAVYTGVTVWNGFLLPLVLTQSPDRRTMPLAVWSFQGQFQVNVPAVLASVVLSTVPIVVLYTIGRRQLVSGLSEGFSK
ncbi:MAG: putative transporter permease protein [Marmoricola sp.]|jgi:raffinose/stachyose/melibiose transport system permease protein|nr:putative transporter permease protein [Marmoricola sp.]